MQPLSEIPKVVMKFNHFCIFFLTSPDFWRSITICVFWIDSHLAFLNADRWRWLLKGILHAFTSFLCYLIFKRNITWWNEKI